jgi:hypothetical protein
MSVHCDPMPHQVHVTRTNVHGKGVQTPQQTSQKPTQRLRGRGLRLYQALVQFQALPLPL